MKFLVRVELHNATYTDYETLHKAMAARGFQRTIRGGDGTLYYLPTAEYTAETTQSGDQVRTAADNAASTTGKPHGVLAVQYDGAWWKGLAQARAA
jgi:hypothetical protein